MPSTGEEMDMHGGRRAGRFPLRADLRCDDQEWERGKAWTFQQAMGLVWHYADSNPAMSRTGRRPLARIRAGA